MLQPGVKKSILEYFGVVLTMFGLGSVILGVWRLTFYHMRPGLEIRKFRSECQKAPRLYNLQTIFSYKQYKPPCCIPPNSKKLTLGKRVLNADRTTSCRKDCRHSILQTKFAYKPRCCIPPNSNKLNPWKTCSKYRIGFGFKLHCGHFCRNLIWVIGLKYAPPTILKYAPPTTTHHNK